MSDLPSNPNFPRTRSSSDGEYRTDQRAEDAHLLKRVHEKDQAAMAAIFDRYAGMAYSVAFRVLKDQAQAEDVIQDLFFWLWQNPDSFAPDRGSLAAWLAVLVRNRAIDVLRKRRPGNSVEDVVLPAATNVASDVEMHTMIERIRRVLAGLPAEQRNSVEMAFFEGLTHSEIAEQTGDPLGTVKTRIRSALISVRKALQG
jgi:RNA polymerase sigma-70 factor (ECF subfamily)